MVDQYLCARRAVVHFQGDLACEWKDVVMMMMMKARECGARITADASA